MNLVPGTNPDEEGLRQHAEGDVYVIGNSALHFYSQ